QYNDQIGAALDIAAGAVLMTAIAAVAIGSSLFVSRWLELSGN
ncbi:MAG TPA: diacylglycerol kinase family protein, partial [Planctomycetes bacterium]|nr:diacylglycerol kinase family protein [Planctomycetota bacterium]